MECLSSLLCSPWDEGWKIAVSNPNTVTLSLLETAKNLTEWSISHIDGSKDTEVIASENGENEKTIVWLSKWKNVYKKKTLQLSYISSFSLFFITFLILRFKMLKIFNSKLVSSSHQFSILSSNRNGTRTPRYEWESSDGWCQRDFLFSETRTECVWLHRIQTSWCIPTHLKKDLSKTHKREFDQNDWKRNEQTNEWPFGEGERTVKSFPLHLIILTFNFTLKRLPLHLSLSTFCLSLHSFLSLSFFFIPWGVCGHSSKTKYLINLYILFHLSILLRMWHPLPSISQIKTFPSDAHEANVFRFRNRTQLTLSEEKEKI